MSAQPHATLRLCPVTDEELEPDFFVSRTAVSRLRAQLRDLGGMMADLDDMVAKQMRFSTDSGPASAERPLPINPAALEEAWVARQTILVWVDQISAIRGHRVPRSWSGVGEYLASAAVWLAQHHDGAQGYDELLHALSVARRTVDRPAERRYAGPCGGLTLDDDSEAVMCSGEVYAYGHNATAQCPRCGAEYDVASRRTWMLGEMGDVLLPAADVARALSGLGVGATSAMVRSWRHRRLLDCVDVDSRGRPLYAVGDAVALALGTTDGKPARVTVYPVPPNWIVKASSPGGTTRP